MRIAFRVEVIQRVVDRDAGLLGIGKAIGLGSQRVDDTDQFHRGIRRRIQRRFQIVAAIPTNAHQGNRYAIRRCHPSSPKSTTRPSSAESLARKQASVTAKASSLVTTGGWPV